MNKTDLRSAVFSDVSVEEWKERAESSLKGKHIQTLNKHTYEKIVLKPLYSGETENKINSFSDLPGMDDYRRGSNTLGYKTESWRIAQQISYHSLEDLKSKLYDSMEKGQTAIAFSLKEQLFSQNKDLLEFLENMDFRYPLAIDANGLQGAFLASLMQLSESKNIFGYAGHDPVSLAAENGCFSEERLQEDIEQWENQILAAHESLPKLRTILINTSVYHNAGASAVEEIGMALATASCYIEKLLLRGMRLETILEKIVFKFSIGGNFFMEMAKLRAARYAWAKMTEAFGAPASSRGMIIAAETSLLTKTATDHHVNILRAGNEAFAAVLGGIQYLHVDPFNRLSGISQLAERLARNTQMILMEEVNLKHVIDPAGGSWYVEEMTRALIEKGWAYFLKIENGGGVFKALEENVIQDDIEKIMNERFSDVYRRKQSLVGTNVYAIADEFLSEVVDEESAGFYQASINDFIEAYKQGTEILSVLKDTKIEKTSPAVSLKKLRLSQGYENLKKQATHLRKSGQSADMALICLGELKEYKQRADFVAGFLAAGGITTVYSGDINDVASALSFIDHASFSHVCLCSSDEQYHALGFSLLDELKKKYPDLKVSLAGLPEDDMCMKWEIAGVNHFIHLKANCYETLSLILSEMGAEPNGH